MNIIKITVKNFNRNPLHAAGDDISFCPGVYGSNVVRYFHKDFLERLSSFQPIGPDNMIFDGIENSFGV